MSRQIVNTGGQGLASSSAVKFAGISLVVGIVVLLVFFALSRATAGRPDVNYGGGMSSSSSSSSSMGAPSPQNT